MNRAAIHVWLDEHDSPWILPVIWTGFIVLLVLAAMGPSWMTGAFTVAYALYAVTSIPLALYLILSPAPPPQHSNGLTESPLEEDLKHVLDRAGFAEPLTQYRVITGSWFSGRTHRLDFAYPDLSLAIEADGKAYHDALRDRERDARLADKGWTTLRFTWQDVHDRPSHIVRALQDRGVPIVPVLSDEPGQPSYLPPDTRAALYEEADLAAVKREFPGKEE